MMDRRAFVRGALLGGTALALQAEQTQAASSAGFDNGAAVVSWDVLAEPKKVAQGRDATNSKVTGTMVLLRVRDPREDGNGQFYITVFGQFRRGDEEWRDCPCHPYYRDVYSFNGWLRDIFLVEQSSSTVSLFLPNNAWNLREIAQIRLVVRFYSTDNQHLSEFDAVLPMQTQPHQLKPNRDIPAETGEDFSLSLTLPAGRPPVDVFSVRTERPLRWQE